MKKLVLLLLLLCPLRAEAAVAFVSSVTAGSTAGLSFTTGSFDTTGANFIICNVAAASSVSVTVSDNKSNGNATARTDYENHPAGNGIQAYYWTNPTVGSGHTVTATGVAYASMTCFALSGVATSSPYDVENGAGSLSVTSQASGSATPSQNNDVCVTAVSLGGSYSSPNTPSSYTAPSPNETTYSSGNHQGILMAYWIQTTATATNPSWSWTTSVHAATNVTCFKEDSGGGGGGGLPSGSLGLLGVGK